MRLKRCVFINFQLRSHTMVLEYRQPRKKRGKGIFIMMVMAVFVLLLFKLLFAKYAYSESGLRRAIREQYALVSGSTDETTRELYRNFIAQSVKDKKTEDDYIAEVNDYKQSNGIKGIKSVLHDVYFDGIDGYADRTVYDCLNESCTDIKSQSRAFRKYIYENKSWVMTDDLELLCPRKAPYEDMAPEFLRAIELISQRLASNSNFQFVKNCIYVTYAETDDEIDGAEGVFKFFHGQSQLKLEIKVSPRYKELDESVLAFLLAHEGEHAANYGAGLLQGFSINCFEDEGRAFNAQYWFFSQLNPDEKDHLIDRIYNGNSSEIRSILTTFISIENQYGSDFVVKATNYVKSLPFYQSQCQGR